MLRERKLNFIGQLFLLFATLAWGSSFVILKDTMDALPGFFVIGVRFVISGLVFALAFIKRLKTMDKKAFLRGLALGTVVAAAYLTQTWGLKYTTPGQNAFITGTYCVMVPFVGWAIYKTAPKICNVVSAVLCLIGIGMVALSGDGGKATDSLLGNGLTLVCAFFYCLQVIFIDGFQRKGTDPVHLLVVNFFVVGVLLLASSFILEYPVMGIKAYSVGGEQWWQMIYLTVVCTLLAQCAQMFGQRFTPSNQAAIILSLEAVFGVVFSIIMGRENVTAMLIGGFAVIFVAMIINETQPDFKKLFTKNTNREKK